ncbi:MAG TPA: copper resistance protein CopC [Anaerolineae bacterium]
MLRILRASSSLAVVASLLAVGVASAHADLLRSNPAANSTLATAPQQVTIWFTEAVEPGFSTISVLYQDGSTADNGDNAVSPTDPAQLTVTLHDAREGTYIVSWRVLSAVDGHITSGSFVFAVGQPIDRTIASAPGGAVTSPLDMAARALNFIGQALLVGALLFRWFVWRPALQSADLGDEVDAIAVRRGRRVVYLALGITALGTLLSLLAQSSAAGATIGAWLSTRIGRIWIGRVATLIALGVLAEELAAAGRKRPGSKLATLALNVTLLWLSLQLPLTTSLTSHSASIATPPLIPLLSDWLHLVATGIWVGGLVQMVFVVPVAARTLDDEDRAWLWLKVVVYFSTVAAIGLGILLITGSYMATLHVGSWDALLNTIYGQALLFKLALAGIAMLLGAFNLLVVKPKLDRAVDEPEAEASKRLQRRFRRTVTLEAFAALAVLASAGILTDLPRSKDPQPVAAGGPLTLTTRAEDLDAQLTLDPATEGSNTFDLKLTQNGEPVTDARQVTLRFTYLARSLGATNADAALTSNGMYAATGAYLSLPGEWQIEASVRRPNAFDVFAAYRVKIGLDGRIVPAGEATLLESIARWLSIYGMAFGGGVAIVMGLMWLVIAVKASRNTLSQVALMIPVVVALPIGALSMMTFFREATPGLTLTNLFLPDEQSLAQGQKLFEANCAVCHGFAGRGDGPAAASLKPHPPDFGNGHLDIHTDGDVFYWIQNGLPTVNSPMPPFKGKLSDEETWNLVNYVRRLRNLAGDTAASNAPQPAATPSTLQPYTPQSFIAPPEGGTNATPVPPTPSAPSDPNALELLKRADAAMNRLTSMAEKQTLRDDAGNQLDVIFTYAAPDRLRYQIVNGATAIEIGADDYQLGPDGQWIKNQRAVPFQWPTFNYGQVAGNAKVEGDQKIGDSDAMIVAFEYGGYQFRFWIDAQTDRIVRINMDGAGHHMISVYDQFDSAAKIEPPIP